MTKLRSSKEDIKKDGLEGVGSGMRCEEEVGWLEEGRRRKKHETSLAVCDNAT